ncbi:hypothetical protein WR25_14583 [Diploscapter pachys]|uniref:Uncharacterized protein n=1 Tax=Diploscapter pachys TaxID=2018661 RepID=A0A2A2LR14_9BILA|nr:hypothetical protein WR25_14583 [Diploscapter pachys]
MSKNTEPDLSFIYSDINPSEVTPVNSRRLAVLVNCYLKRIMNIMNSYANKFESALLEAEHDLAQLETKMQILEAKLKNISPEEAAEFLKTLESSKAKLDEIKHVVTANEIPKVPEMDIKPETSVPQLSANANPETPSKLSPTSQAMLFKDDPRYTKYFKMLNLGVPADGVKQKMRSEGVDGSILDRGNEPSDAIVTTQNPDTEKRKDSESNDDDDDKTDDSQSVSSFSD